MMPTTLLFGFLAFTSANLLPRDNSTSVASSPPSTTSWALTPAQICLQSCAAGDVNCEAQCIGSAHPNSVQVSETNECAAKCPQGNGTYSESSNYASCLQACISSYYPTSLTAGAVGVGGTKVASNGASVTGTVTGNVGGVATGTGTKSSGSTGTGAGAALSTSKGAAANLAPWLGSVGRAAGLFMMCFAL